MNALTLLGATVLALGGALALRPAQAQEDNDGWRRFDMNISHHHLTAGLAPWQETSLRGVYKQGEHLWSGELLHADRFDERGNYGLLQDTVRLAPNWHASLAYGLGDGANWLPRYRLDGFVHHSWGAQRNWVTHLGLGEVRAPDEHRDRWGSVGLSAYLDHSTLGPWVAQGEVRVTRSDPGQVQTRQHFIALTAGHHRATQLTWRHGWGREGWQSLGDARGLVDFASRQDTLTLQHWIEAEWGLRLVADHYRNDQYSRRGWTLGVFREWP
jgi:YaiO family outer membrane protein